jgi:hypothetical protein
MSNVEDPHPVRTALERLTSARRATKDDLVAKDEDAAKAANRRVYEALSQVCRAYVGQFVDRSGLPRTSPSQEIFPPEVAHMFHAMLEGWLVGKLDRSLRDLVERAGTPGRNLLERNDVEAACRYMQAADIKLLKPLIDDGAPVEQIAEWYGVNRVTAQSWKRAEKRNLLADYMPHVSDDQRAKVIRNRAMKAGRRHAQYGRGQGAIRKRSNKRV